MVRPGRPVLNRSKVGALPAQAVVDTLYRRHPDVQLMWAENLRRWCLVQVNPSPMHLIRVLQTKDGRYLHPTIDNSVYLLDAMHPRHFRSHFQQEKFLAAIDEIRENKDIDRRAKDAIAEGSSELYHAMKRRVVVPR